MLCTGSMHEKVDFAGDELSWEEAKKWKHLGDAFLIVQMGTMRLIQGPHRVGSEEHARGYYQRTDRACCSWGGGRGGIGKEERLGKAEVCDL